MEKLFVEALTAMHTAHGSTKTIKRFVNVRTENKKFVAFLRNIFSFNCLHTTLRFKNVIEAARLAGFKRCFVFTISFIIR